MLLKINAWWIWAMSIIFLIIIIITKKRLSIFVVIFLSLIVGVFVTLNAERQKDNVEESAGQSVNIKASVGKVIATKQGYNLVLEDAVDEENSYGRLLLECTDDINVQVREDAKESKRSNPKTNLKIGNRVAVSGKIYLFDKARNPGNFDSRKYYLSIGIYGKLKNCTIKSVDTKYDFIRQNLFEMRCRIKGVLSDICQNSNLKICGIEKDKNGIFEGIILGDKTEIDSDIKELYSISGISHILAISGLHISMIGIFLYSLLRKRFKFVVSSGISVFVVVLFSIMSGMGIATIRALIMFGLRMLGEVLGRIYDAMTAMATAGIVLILWNPYVIFHSGFLMSFVAIFSIVIMWPKVFYILGCKKPKPNKGLDKNTMTRKQKIIEKIRLKGSGVVNAFLFSANVSVYMIPVTAYFYFQVPSFSFFLNVIVVPLMSIVVVSGIAGIIGGGIAGVAGGAAGVVGSGATSIAGGGGVVGSSICTSIGSILILPGCVILELYSFLCRMITSIPYSNIIVGQPPLAYVFVYYAVLYLSTYLCQEFKKKRELKEQKQEKAITKEKIISSKELIKRKKKVYIKYQCVYIAIVITLIWGIYLKPLNENLKIVSSGKISVTFVDVGQGDGIFIKTDNGKNILVDGGSTTVGSVGQYRLVPFLKSQSYSILDYVFVTHADTDHISGIKEIIEQSLNGVRVRNLVLPIININDTSYNDLMSLAKKHKFNVLYIKKEKSMNVGGVKIDCLNPDENISSEDRNDYSTVLSVRYKRFSMLLTGDISSEVEERLVAGVNSPEFCREMATGNNSTGYGQKMVTRGDVVEKVTFESSVSSAYSLQLLNKYTILKVAHHGSKYSTSSLFLERINPSFAVISSGKGNNYGHPSSETLNRLSDKGSKVLRTDELGAIMFESDGNSVWWKGYLEEK